MRRPDRRPKHLQTTWLKDKENALKKNNKNHQNNPKTKAKPTQNSPRKLLKAFFLKKQTFPHPWLNNHKLVPMTPPCSDEIVHDESKHLRGGPGDQRGEVKGQEGLVGVLMTKQTVMGNQFPNKDH